jgi:hypothetical protein
MALLYETSGQQLGETRTAMTKDLMQKDLEPLINKLKDKREKYYILIHAKPVPGNRQTIWKKIIVMNVKPSMMLSCMLFGVDNASGTLTLEWALPGDWPTWAVGGSNEPIPETIAAVKAGGIKYHYENFLP